MKAITIDHERCTLCGLCVKTCVRRILQKRVSKIICTEPDRCIFCGHCKAVCPVDAPQVASYRAEEFVPVPARENYPLPDDLLAFFRVRRSLRVYKKKPVERKKIEKIIQAGRFAPTGGNRQHIEYVVIQNPDKFIEIRNTAIKILKNQADEVAQTIADRRAAGKPTLEKHVLAERYVRTWQDMYSLHKKGVDRLFYNAPALIVCHFAPMGGISEVVDSGLASMQMVLMAEALGLGTCFIGLLAIAAEKSPALKEAMGIPKKHVIPVIFTLGYPAVHYERLVSRRLAQVKWI